MADMEQQQAPAEAPEDTVSKKKPRAAGSDAGSDDPEPEYCMRSLLPFLPAPFGNVWIRLLFCAAAEPASPAESAATEPPATQPDAAQPAAAAVAQPAAPLRQRAD